LHFKKNNQGNLQVRKQDIAVLLNTKTHRKPQKKRQKNEQPHINFTFLSPADTDRAITQIGHVPACPNNTTHYTTKTSIQQTIFKINFPGPKKPPQNPIFMPNSEKYKIGILKTD
jgi:hypothetical protein